MHSAFFFSGLDLGVDLGPLLEGEPPRAGVRHFVRQNPDMSRIQNLVLKWP